MSEIQSDEQETRPQPEPAGTDADKSSVQVVLTAEDRAEVSETVSQSPEPAAAARRPGVHVAENLLDIATGRVETAAERQAAQQEHKLNEAVHGILTIGLAVSTVLMLIGILGDLLLGRTMPTAEPGLSQIVQSLVELRPSGFMSLGLLVLLGTPIIRVIGSVGAFVYERDWHYAGITFLVLVIVLSSIMFGRG